MKKNDWIFLATVTTYSILFYKQMPGLNFFIFSCILLCGQILMCPGIFRNKKWLFAAIGAVCTSFCVLNYNYTLCIFGSFVTLMLASYFAFNKNGSVLAGLFSSFISATSSIGFMIARFVDRLRNKSENGKSGRVGKRTIIVLFALIVVLIFFFMYRESSVLFYQLTEKINFDWISFGWIIFTLIGALVIYGYFFHNSIPGFSEWDGKQRLILTPKEEQSGLDKLMSVESEKFSGIVLFSLLNILVLVVNGLDFTFIFCGDGKLPQGISSTEYVHQGVGMLITSIVFAMLIILYYFRGRLNFSGNGKLLRNLALLWIIQNAFMLISTAWRNDVYIFAFGLTYKRIGVFVYLLLTIIGLIVTAWKVLGKKTNAFLIRTNSLLFIGVWIIACFFNWDKIIVDFNTQKIQKPDLNYLNSLSTVILPQLISYSKNHPDQAEINYVGRSIQERTYLFLNDQKFLSENDKWPSYSIYPAKIYDELKDRKDFGNLVQLNLSYSEMKTIYYFPAYEKIRSLELSGNELKDLGEVSQFKNLQVLDLSNNPELKSLAGIEKADSLQYLSINGTGITDYSPLLKLKNLKKIVSGNMSAEIESQLRARNPEVEIERTNQTDSNL
jgi:hypothetical protein